MHKSTFYTIHFTLTYSNTLYTVIYVFQVKVVHYACSQNKTTKYLNIYRLSNIMFLIFKYFNSTKHSFDPFTSLHSSLSFLYHSQKKSLHSINSTIIVFCANEKWLQGNSHTSNTFYTIPQ